MYLECGVVHVEAMGLLPCDMEGPSGMMCIYLILWNRVRIGRSDRIQLK